MDVLNPRGHRGKEMSITERELQKARELTTHYDASGQFDDGHEWEKVYENPWLYIEHKVPRSRQLTLFPYVCGCGGEIDYHQVYRKNLGISPWRTCFKCMKSEYLDKGVGI